MAGFDTRLSVMVLLRFDTKITRPTQAMGRVIFGLALGFAISALPLDLIVVGGFAVFAAWILISMLRRVDFFFSFSWTLFLTTLMTVIIAIYIPVKSLDGKVEPFQYETMSLENLSRALLNDHRIRVYVHSMPPDMVFNVWYRPQDE
jgi:hypothetical protein